MKRIFDMNDEELLALDEDSVVKLIDYECALEGIPMLPPNPGPPPVAEKDVVVYKVGGFKTTSSEHASCIMKAVVEGPLVKTVYDHNYKDPYIVQIVQDDHDYPKVETELRYSAELWDVIKTGLEKFESCKVEYSRLDKAFKEALAARSDIDDRAWGQISEARTRRNDREEIRSQFARYLELAENNTTVAMNFLLKARPAICGEYPEMIEELCPFYGKPRAEVA